MLLRTLDLDVVPLRILRVKRRPDTFGSEGVMGGPASMPRRLRWAHRATPSKGSTRRQIDLATAGPQVDQAQGFIAPDQGVQLSTAVQKRSIRSRSLQRSTTWLMTAIVMVPMVLSAQASLDVTHA